MCREVTHIVRQEKRKKKKKKRKKEKKKKERRGEKNKSFTTETNSNMWLKDNRNVHASAKIKYGNLEKTLQHLNKYL